METIFFIAILIIIVRLLIPTFLFLERKASDVIIISDDSKEGTLDSFANKRDVRIFLKKTVYELELDGYKAQIGQDNFAGMESLGTLREVNVPNSENPILRLFACKTTQIGECSLKGNLYDTVHEHTVNISFEKNVDDLWIGYGKEMKYRVLTKI